LQSLEDLFKYVNMANWQFPFFILPNRWIQQQSDGFEKYLSEDGWELPNALASENRKLDYLSELDLFLNKAASWSEQLAIWKSPKHDNSSSALFVSFRLMVSNNAPNARRDNGEPFDEQKRNLLGCLPRQFAVYDEQVIYKSWGRGICRTL